MKIAELIAYIKTNILLCEQCMAVVAFFCAKSFITLFRSMLRVLAVLLGTNTRGEIVTSNCNLQLQNFAF